MFNLVIRKSVLKSQNTSWITIVFVQMYNQSGMGGEGGIRPPVSLPSLPLPPDLSRLHQEKALNLQVQILQVHIWIF
jgi:hypothetical protein